MIPSSELSRLVDLESIAAATGGLHFRAGERALDSLPYSPQVTPQIWELRTLCYLVALTLYLCEVLYRRLRQPLRRVEQR